MERFKVVEGKGRVLLKREVRVLFEKKTQVKKVSKFRTPTLKGRDCEEPAWAV